jgi:flagellar M-ring protein FliF
VNKSTEVTKAAPGGVERQSVAVAVNADVAAGLDMAGLQAMVAAAAGIDATRGDTIEVQSMAFDTTQAEAAQEALAQADAAAKVAAQNALVQKGAIAGAVLIGLIVLIIILASVRRSSRKARRTSLDLGELSVLNGAGNDPLALEGVDVDELPALPAAPVSLAPDPVALKRAEIGALADEQPDEVADLLRGWLAESGAVRR